MDNQTKRLLETLVDSPNVKAVSFDVFDTLLFRPGFEPVDLFHLLSECAARLLGVLDFFPIRIAAEGEMAALSGSVPYRNLHTLEDIYRHIAKAHDLDEEKCSELCRIELDLERSVLRPRNDVRGLYERAIRSGKRVIAISDTYFSKSFMKILLDQKGFDQISEIYVSNDCGRRKDLGDIYSHVLECEDFDAINILHIGDNLHSDLMMASAAGVMAVHCPAIIPGLFGLGSSKWSEALAGTEGMDPAARLLLGLAINEWFAEHPADDGASLFEGDLRLFGFIGLGPILFHIAQEIGESQEIQGVYSHVCFASRDGYLPKLAYDILQEGRAKKPSRYVYCGRAAYHIYRYKGDPAAFMLEPTLRSNGYTLRSLLSSIFQTKNHELFADLINSLQTSELEAEYLDAHDAIKRICIEYDERLREFFENELALASRYYSEKIASGESSRGIIFDVGYGGSVSRAIGALAEIKIDKIYLDADEENARSDQNHGTSTRVLIPDAGNLKRDVPGMFLLFEELFSPAEPACVGFQGGAEIAPVFASDEVFEQRMKSDLASMQTAALDFVRIAKSTFASFAPYLRVSAAQDLLRPIQYAFARGRECEERMLSQILYPDRFFHNHPRPLSTKVVHFQEYGNLPTHSGFDEPSRLASSSVPIPGRQVRVAIHLFINDCVAMQSVVLALAQIPFAADILISVEGEQLRGVVENMMMSTYHLGHIRVMAADARGGIGSWIVATAAIQDSYDLVCHFDGSSPDGVTAMTPGWFRHLMEATLSKAAVAEILADFDGNPELGLLLPPEHRASFDAMRMAPEGIVPQSVRNEMDRLLAELNVRTGYNRSDFYFPIGDAFWYRPTALRALVSLACQQGALSSVTSTAISRILAVSCRAQGFVVKTFIPSTILLRSYSVQQEAIKSLGAALAHTRQDLAHTQQELDRVTGSRRWRVASAAAVKYGRLLPVGSGRRRLADSSLRRAWGVAKRVRALSRNETEESVAHRVRASIFGAGRSLNTRAKIWRLNRFNADRPVFSVVIPIYDRTWQLELAIESILKQTFRNFELILVCDGSPAETLKIVDRYAAHPQVRIHKFSDNSGNACRGRNTGIKMARGTYVAFMDSDDLASRKRLSISLFHFLRTAADMVYGSVTIISDGARKIEGVWDGQFRKSFAVTTKEMEEVNPAWTSTVAVRREALQRFGGFRTEMRYREDQELWLRLAHNGCRLYAVEEMLAYYRFHESNAELLFKDRDAHWKSLMLKMYRQPFEE